MKRVWVYIVLLAAALAVPVNRTDVGKLLPIETLFLYMEENEVTIETDTGNTGKGRTVSEAVRDLHETAAGYLYLDTADYLLVEKEAEVYLEEIEPYLKGTVRVCEADKGIDLMMASEYLAVHPLKDRIKVAKINGITEKIKQNGKQMKIIKKFVISA